MLHTHVSLFNTLHSSLLHNYLIVMLNFDLFVHLSVNVCPPSSNVCLSDNQCCIPGHCLGYTWATNLASLMSDLYNFKTDVRYIMKTTRHF